jgi:hypothetical protein
MLKFGGSSYLIWDPIGGVKGTLRWNKVFIKPIKITALLISYRFNIESRVNNITIAGMRSCVWCIISQSPEFQERITTHFRVLSSNPRVQRNSHVVKHWIGWVGFADTQISILPGVSRKCNVRSKIWWFTKICNSHYVSHFAAFFIVVGTKTSVAESRMAFASYAKGKVSVKGCFPRLLFLRLSFVSFVFGIVVKPMRYHG